MIPLKLLLSLVALIVLAVIWLIVRLKGTMRKLVTAAVVAAQPERIQLVRDANLRWVNRNRVARQVRAFRALGFKTVGDFRVPEMPDLQLVGLGQPEVGFGAVICEHQQTGAIACDVVARYRDGGSLTVTNAPQVKGLEPVPGFEKIHLKKASPRVLVRTLEEYLPPRPLLPIHPKNFVSVFERDYADQMASRDELGSPGAAPAADPELDAQCAPLFHAIASRNAENVATFLAQGIPPEGRNPQRLTPLMAAIDTGEYPFVRALVDAGADVNARAPGVPGSYDPAGAIDQAAAAGDDEARRFMKGLGLVKAIAGGPAWQVTPLSIAIECGVAEIVTSLLDAGARLVDHRTPLRLAAEVGDVDVVRTLLNRGHDVDEEGQDGTTPLLAAAAEGYLDVVRILVDAEADPNLAGAGEAPITAAAAAGFSDLVGYLSPLSKPKYEKKARKILAETAEEGSAGVNPAAKRLLRAAMGGRTPMVRKLLATGLHPDAAEREGDEATPLALATRFGHLEIMQLLIAAGADVNALDPESRAAAERLLAN